MRMHPPFSKGRCVEPTVVLHVLLSLVKEVIQFVQSISQILIMLGHLFNNDNPLLFHAPNQHDLVKQSPLQA